MTKPYKQKNINREEFIRVFKSSVDPAELIWHRDRNTRVIEVLEGEGWQFQYERDIPMELRKGLTFTVPKEAYHRLIIGATDLKIRIKEIK